jgi:ABC-type transport system substrate-binding protein
MRVAAKAGCGGERGRSAGNRIRDVAAFGRTPASTYSRHPTGYKVYVNNNRGACKDERVRKALSLAINRDDYIARYAGEAFVTPGPLVKGGALANPDEPDPVSDPAEAKQLLAAAGYADGISFDRLFTTTEPADQTNARYFRPSGKRPA